MTEPARFALVALMPEPKDDAQRMDFVSREFATPQGVADLIAELEEKVPNWRAITICHIEDLPLLMEPPNG